MCVILQRAAKRLSLIYPSSATRTGSHRDINDSIGGAHGLFGTASLPTGGSSSSLIDITRPRSPTPARGLYHNDGDGNGDDDAPRSRAPGYSRRLSDARAQTDSKVTARASRAGSDGADRSVHDQDLPTEYGMVPRQLPMFKVQTVSCSTLVVCVRDGS